MAKHNNTIARVEEDDMDEPMVIPSIFPHVFYLPGGCTLRLDPLVVSPSDGWYYFLPGRVLSTSYRTDKDAADGLRRSLDILEEKHRKAPEALDFLRQHGRLLPPVEAEEAEDAEEG